MEALRRFASTRFLVEAPPARAALALAACLAAVPAAAAPTAPAEGYRDAVATVQAGLDAWLGKGRAVVFDRSAPREAEIARLSRRLGAEGRKDLADPGVASVVLDTAGVRKYGSVCLVVGGEADRTPADILSVQGVARAAPGDVTPRDAHVLDLWSGGAMCGFETARDSAAMAVLASARDTASRDLPGLAAAALDLADWSDVPAGNAGVSGEGAQWAAAAATRLRAGGRLAKAPYRELARMAVSAGRRQPTGYDMAYDAKRLADVRALKAWYVPAAEGAVSVDFRTWLRRSSIPEARHYGALLDYVEGTDRTPGPLPALSTMRGVPSQGSVDHAAADARLGDTGAAAFADLAETNRIEARFPEKAVASRRPASWDDIPGERIPFDRASARLVAPGDGSTYEIRDVATGAEIARGEPGQGVAAGPRP